MRNILNGLVAVYDFLWKILILPLFVPPSATAIQAIPSAAERYLASWLFGDLSIKSDDPEFATNSPAAIPQPV